MKIRKQHSGMPFLAVFLLPAILSMALPINAQDDVQGKSCGTFPSLGAVTHDTPTMLEPGKVGIRLDASAMQMARGQRLGSDVNGSLGVVHRLDKRNSEQNAACGVFRWSQDKAEDKDAKHQRKSYEKWQGRIYSERLNYTRNATLIPTPQYGDGTCGERPFPVTYPNWDSGVVRPGTAESLGADHDGRDLGDAANRLNPIVSHRQEDYLRTISAEESANLDDYVNDRVRFTGIAFSHPYVDGAWVSISGVGVVLIHGLESWPEQLDGKRIAVTGVLMREDGMTEEEALEADWAGYGGGITGTYYVVHWPCYSIESNEE